MKSVALQAARVPNQPEIRVSESGTGSLEPARSRMDRFIESARKESAVLLNGFCCKWEDPTWVVRKPRRGSTSFTSLNLTVRPRSGEVLPQPFLDQSRAVVASEWLVNPRIDHRVYLRCLRLIHELLRETGREPDMVLLNQHDVDLLNLKIANSASGHSKWNIGRHMVGIINRALQANGLTALPVHYASPFKKEMEQRTHNYVVMSQKTENEVSSARMKLVLNQRIVNLLGSLFAEPGSEHRHYNMVGTAFAALAMFAPSRTSEIVTLPLNCATRGDDDRSDRPRVGLSWFPAKGGTPLTKYAVTKSWESIALKAIERLEHLGRQARKAAKWMEDNPGRLHLPLGTEHLRGKPLTRSDIAAIIGWDTPAQPEFHTAHAMMRALDFVKFDAKRNQPLYSGRSAAEFIRRYFDGIVKTIPDCAPAAETEPGTACAEWLSRLEGDRDLTADECLALIGMDRKSAKFHRNFWCITNSLKKTPAAGSSDPSRPRGREGEPMYEFDSLEKWVLEKIRKQFPTVDPQQELTCSSALFCLPLGIANPGGCTYWNIPRWLHAGNVQSAFFTRQNQSILSLNNLLDPETGEPYYLTPHQFRHLLNTLAQSKFVSQSVIANWSGRESAAQNDDYDHTPQEAIVGKMNALNIGTGDGLKIQGPLGKAVAKHMEQKAISFEQALEMETGAVHTTRYGMCRHDFSLAPCPHFMDCANCSESVFIAHDPRMVREARQQVELARKALGLCEDAKRNGEAGVDRWSEKERKSLKQWTEVLERITDGDTEPGTVVTLSRPKVAGLPGKPNPQESTG